VNKIGSKTLQNKFNYSAASRQYFILVGDRRTWNVSIDKSIWGFSERTKGLRDHINKGDYAAFYVTRPTRKIIGFGKFDKKFLDETCIWPMEKLYQKSFWKYRISFKIIYIVRNWAEGLTLPEDVVVNSGRKKINEKVFMNLINDAELKWHTKLR